MADVLVAPTLLPAHFLAPAVFLGGSIEMGTAEPWQDHVLEALLDRHVVLLNPRRPDWDSSWVQDRSNPQFAEQVHWELAAMERADVIVLYFSPPTKSPITLLELGLWARDHSRKLMVCCPPGFWRRGNVQLVCDRYAVPLYETLDSVIGELRTRLSPAALGPSGSQALTGHE